MTIEITSSLDGITAAHLDGGFWEHWPTPPSPERHLELLRGSRAVALALDEGQVVGFANAVGDGVLSAYIPLLEVLPALRGTGIGTQLIERLIEELSPCYMIDVACDDDVVPFYDRLGFTRGNAMVRRDYAAQSGMPPR
ncbi:MAG: acetyltransferase [Thermoleophilia bacterium]|nr:acetyltransferase [Thermoleophilia bacterium]